MTINLKSVLPIAALVVGALVAPAQAQTMPNSTAQPSVQTEKTPSDNIGIDNSDPYSEQVYSGSQTPDTAMPMGDNMAVPANNRRTNAMRDRSNQTQQSYSNASRLQQLRYQVLDRPSS